MQELRSTPVKAEPAPAQDEASLQVRQSLQLTEAMHRNEAYQRELSACQLREEQFKLQVSSALVSCYDPCAGIELLLLVQSQASSWLMR